MKASGLSDNWTAAEGRFARTDASVEALWIDYRFSRGPQARDQLIVFYAPFVKLITDRLAAQQGSYVDRADLASYGLFGLIDAIERFDPSYGIRFETYASFRIRGAVIDELRSMDWVPRKVRADARAIERISARLESELHRRPSQGEIAAELGIDPDHLAVASAHIAASTLLRLDAPRAALGDDNARSTELADPMVTDDPFESLATTECLTQAINNLPERQRLIVTLYYYERLTLNQIGTIFGVTESRICQLHTKALRALRGEIERAERGVPSPTKTQPTLAGCAA